MIDAFAVRRTAARRCFLLAYAYSESIRIARRPAACVAGPCSEYELMALMALRAEVLLLDVMLVTATLSSAGETAPTSSSPPIPRLTATAQDFNRTGWPFAGAYLSNGFTGVRVGPRALVRDPWAGGTGPGNSPPPMDSTLVGGYLELEHEVKGAPTPPTQTDGMTTYAAAPFPFETEVVVMPPPGGGPIFRLSEASPPRPSSRMSQRPFQGSNMSSYITCLNQTLDMATGELTTHLRIAPPSGSGVRWSLDLSVLQFLSRDIPSLGVQQIVATAKPSSLHYVLQPHITSDGLSGTAQRYYNTIPIRSHWGEGPAYGVAMRTNTNSEVALGVETMCDNNTLPTDYKQSQAQGCDSSNLKGGQQGTGELSMTSFVSIVSDVYHARPSVAALELAHKGMYIGFDRLQARNRAVWRESWCVVRNRETVIQPS